jgi:hypothetical protein
MVSQNLLLLNNKVQRFTKQLFEVVQIDDDGDLSIPYESTHIYVSCHELDQSSPEVNEFRKNNEISTTVVKVWAIVLRDVKGTSDLYKWIATEGQVFDYGRFRLIEHSDSSGNYNVIFENTFPGDHLDSGELKTALVAVAFTADGEDDDLKAKFGGKTVEDLRQ